MFKVNKKNFKKIYFTLEFLAAMPLYILLLLFRPLIVIRVGRIVTQSIGHLAANTELYICEKRESKKLIKQRQLDLLYPNKFISNYQLFNMWSRQIKVLPYWTSWILAPLNRACLKIPGGKVFAIKTTEGRDVSNLLEKYPPELRFNSREEEEGRIRLLELGVPSNIPFICLIVRDSSYLSSVNNKIDYSYHNYRDSNIDNYILVAKELVKRGYYVIRMGSKVKKSFNVIDPMIIDYATSEYRTDFMDIYLCAKCKFCVSTGTGLDGVCEIFRKPIVYTNFVPLGYFNSFRMQSLTITKRHFSHKLKRELTLREIFSNDVAFSLRSEDFKSKGVELIENEPEEIRDVVVEMLERLDGTWIDNDEDKLIREKFLEIFKANCQVKKHLHGEFRSNYGVHFLKSKISWLQ